MVTVVAAARPRPPPMEVVIDGDSTEDEDDVAEVVAPPSRKRKRASLIADEEDEGEVRASQSALSIAAVEREQKQDENSEEDGEDEEDEVEIVPPPVSGGKSRRLTIMESDEEQQQQPKRTRVSPRGVNGTDDRRNSATPTTQAVQTQRSTSSTRRSSRIEKRQKEKELLNSVTRRLDYPVLDNCLDIVGRSGRADDAKEEDDPDYQEEEENEDDDDFEVQEESYQRPKKRQRREVEREVLHADGGEDLDEFIVGDDEIEYMDDDENGVISVDSESEGEFDAQEELDAMRAARSRETNEWFAIYLAYLEDSMEDPHLDAKLRRSKKLQHRLYQEAIRHIERQICSRRDTIRSNTVWPEDLVDALLHSSYVRWEHIDATQECQACNRSGHYATYRVYFSGIACDASVLYRENWMQSLREAIGEAEPYHAVFDMGSTCHSRTIAYWQLLHAKQMWCAIVDAKRQPFADGRRRIYDAERDEFFKKEYGRFKRLIGLVDRFSTEARQSAFHMGNVWKNVSYRRMQSEFLPRPGHKGAASNENRRGTLDSLVSESDDDEDDEEAAMEVEEAAKASRRASLAADSDEEKAPTPIAKAAKSPNSVRKSPVSTATQTASPELQAHEEEEKSVEAKAEPHNHDDLVCLVCHKNARNAVVAHGLYVHYYCCYGCAKKQNQEKTGCLVCQRPIDRVMRMLPVSKEMREAIAKEGASKP